MYILFEEPEKAQTRRKHERYTQFCVFFVQTEDKSSGENIPFIYEKISGLNWTTEKQRVKMTRWNQLVKMAKCSEFGLVESQPHHFAPRWREVINFIAGCDEVALKNATSYFFSKNLLTKSDPYVIIPLKEPFVPLMQI